MIGRDAQNLVDRIFARNDTAGDDDHATAPFASQSSSHLIV